MIKFIEISPPRGPTRKITTKGVKLCLLQNGSKNDEKTTKIDAKIGGQKVGLKMIKIDGYKMLNYRDPIVQKN
jgi:hypothetical protein